MKTLKFIFPLLLLAFALTSCEKEKNSTIKNSTSTPKFLGTFEVVSIDNSCCNAIYVWDPNDINNPTFIYENRTDTFTNIIEITSLPGKDSLLITSLWSSRLNTVNVIFNRTKKELNYYESDYCYYSKEIKGEIGFKDEDLYLNFDWTGDYYNQPSQYGTIRAKGVRIE